MDRVRQMGMVEQLVPLSVADLRQALRRMKARAGLGADQLSPVDLERLPDEGLEDLCQLFLAVEQG
eukprot:2770838-Pyramimonas_sp.AAC.1